ncbi:hypothetical protein QFZ49_005747 [Streptomyces turgidiscabies]|uniref:Transposase n=1 Tax=Streptomyces turgidiscabies TaxID=85558 RepID=A0ABU0RY00_9ACTN|nr:hypothetical protein [Streptomyces turgidiscabies]
MHGCCSLYDFSMQKLVNPRKGQLGRANPHDKARSRTPPAPTRARRAQGPDLGITENGELKEQSSCRCGATWTKTYQVTDDRSEQASKASIRQARDASPCHLPGRSRDP